MNPAGEQDLLDAFPWPAAVVDPRGRLLVANRSLLRLVRTSAEEAPGRSLSEILRDAPLVERILDRLCGMRAEGPLAWRAPSGDVMELRLYPYGQGAGRRGLLLALPKGSPQVPDPEVGEGQARRVRHDVNNMLMALMGHVELLQKHPDLPPSLHRNLQIIAGEARRIRERVAGLGKPGTDGHDDDSLPE